MDFQPKRLHLNHMAYVKMSTKPKSWSPVLNIPKFKQGIQITPVVYVALVLGANSIFCTSCDLRFHNKYSGITDHLTDNRKLVFCKYFGEIVPAAMHTLNKLTSGMIVFMLNPPSNILVIWLANVVVVLTQSLYVLSPRGKHSEDCYPFSLTLQSEQNIGEMSSTCL